MRANPNFTYLRESVPKNRFTLLQGSTRSGKTYSICYYIIDLCRNYKGIEIDIVRDTFTALRATIWKDFENILKEHGIYTDKNHNKTEHSYNLFGNTISYYGCDNPEKVHGRSRDILILNEGNQISKDIIDQLFPRTRHRIIIDYNPALPEEHWIDYYIEKYPPLITTYRENPYLTASQIEEIESRMNQPYWWAVYGTGQRCKPQGVILTNWEIGDFDNSLPDIYGQDYGFSKDPSTLIRVAFDKKKNVIYAHECFYEIGLHTNDIYNLNRQHAGRKLIVGDSAEMRLISELQRMGLRIEPCTKGADSVRSGLKSLQAHKIIVTPTSKNLIKELNSYTWHDKKHEVPIDDYNHLIDPLRYAYSRLNSQGKGLRAL